MSDVFDYRAGATPLLISVPHDGRRLPDEMAARMTAAGRAIPDTDWHVAELYAFATELGAAMIVANYSRYVVDLNRSSTDEVLYPGQVATGLCPEQTFAGDALYLNGGVAEAQKTQRVARYWQPYHEALAVELHAVRERFGYALLWDAHSIPSTVPRLFDGELPELNLGSNSGASCGESIRTAVHAVAERRVPTAMFSTGASKVASSPATTATRRVTCTHCNWKSRNVPTWTNAADNWTKQERSGFVLRSGTCCAPTWMRQNDEEDARYSRIVRRRWRAG